MNDIIIIDDLLPKQTSHRFTQYVSDPGFAWNDYNHIHTTGMYYERLSFDADVNVVPTDSLVKVCYYNNFRKEEILDQTVYWLSIAVLDEYCRRTGDTVNQILRVKVNNQGKSLVPGYDENCCNEIHVDTFEPHKTIVYYLNDSDGDTFLFDQLYDQNKNHYDVKTLERVSPKQNRLAKFNGHRFHSPSNPLYHHRRYLLNINFI